MKLETAVVGTGLMGKMHAHIYATLPNCKLIAVADRNEKNLRQATRELRVKGYTDVEEMLEKEPEIQALSICTPDDTHHQIAVPLLRRGKHLLIEKPIDRTIEGSERIIAEAQTAGVKLMTAHLLRFDAGYSQAYQAIRDGVIGNIVHVYARRNDLITDFTRLGPITTLPFYLGVHDYDIMNWFIQSKAKNVYAVANALVLKEYHTDDSVFALFKYADGTIACWEASWIMPESIGKSDMSIEVVGTKGVIYVDGYHTSLRIHTENFKMADTMYCAPIGGRITGALREQLIHFVDCVVNDKEPLISGADALEAVRMAWAVEESLAKQNLVAL